MNKLIIMLPVMFAARRLDSEDPQTVYWLRIAYGVIQTICLLAVVYTYYRATLVSSLQTVVYVPPPPQVSCTMLHLFFCINATLRKQSLILTQSMQLWYFESNSPLPTPMPRKSTLKHPTAHTSYPRHGLYLDRL